MEAKVLGGEVPINIEDLQNLRVTFANIGVALMRAHQQAEEGLNAHLMLICLKHGVSPEDFEGVDLEKGVLRTKTQTLIVPKELLHGKAN